MLDALLLPFMQRALIAGVLMGLLGGYFGVFVVQRRLAFLGDGLAHAAFGGVALGLLLDTSPLAVAVPFTVLAAAGMTWLKPRTRLGDDTAVGIFFAVSMALGIVFISLKAGFAPDAFAFLFGSILSVRGGDLAVAASLSVLVALSWRLWGRWAYATFDPELARGDRIPVQRDNYLLAILLALTVVTGIKLVGVVLVTAFLIIPAASARLLSASYAAMTLLAMAVGAASAIGGLLASYSLDLPSGATIILAQAALFGLALISAEAGRRRRVPDDE